MRFTFAFALASAAALAAAQTTAAPVDTGICAQNIVDACVAQYDTQVKQCAGNDWVCLCDTYSNKLVCYNNCPSSEDRAPVQNQVTQFCNAAAPLKAAASASAATAAKVATSATASAETTATGTSSASATSETASSFNEGAAADMKVPVINAILVLLGGIGLVL